MSEKTETGCPSSGCSHCAVDESAERTGGPAGWKLVLSSAGVFLFPLVLAILGAGILRRSQALAAIGAVIGLAVGVLIAMAVQRLVQKKSTRI